MESVLKRRGRACPLRGDGCGARQDAASRVGGTPVIVGVAVVQAIGLALVALAAIAIAVVARSLARRVRGDADVRDALQSTVSEELESTLEPVRRAIGAELVLVVIGSPGSGQIRVVESTKQGSTDLRQVSLPAIYSRLATEVGRVGGVLVTGRGGSPTLEAALVPRGLGHGAALPLLGDANEVIGMLVVGRARGRMRRDDRHRLALVAERLAAQLESDRLERSVRDLTTMRNELRHRADHDPLTGLPNRTLLTKKVTQALAEIDEKTTVAVLFLDLDDFKVVNDVLGHQAGDELLVSVARRVSAAIRPVDMAARLGGDEFAVLVRCIDANDGERVAIRLVEALDAPFGVSGRDVSVRASVGIAYGSAGRIDTEEILRNADLAMYEAKRDGKGRYARFDRRMLDRVRTRHELVVALEKAVERNEIQVHYQPIVNLGSRQLVAVEALARWHRPGHMLTEPEGFIGVADEAGLMPSIGRSVLAIACRQVRDWQRIYPGCAQLEVTVNLAPTELADSLLVHDVAAILEDTGFDPSRLILEITESGVMRNPEQARRSMLALRELGVRLALDDFGTGHSSLAHLREFPLDLLKIARPFVEQIVERERDAVFVETIVRLAASLELPVVAEGIETELQAAAVSVLGCELGQGYLFGRPVGSLGMTRYLVADTLPPALPSVAVAS